FAPNPGVSDHYLLFRDRLVTGSVTCWREIALSDRRRWWRAVWHPHRRRRKALMDLVSALAQMGVKDNALTLSVPYLLLLDLVSRHEHSPLSAATQFTILTKTPCTDTTAIAFLS